jgi:lipoprotein NlpD
MKLAWRTARVIKARGFALCGAAILVLSACGGTRMGQAPVIDRLPAKNLEASPSAAAGSAPAVDQVHIVKSGETLYSIALEHAQDWRELAKINNLPDSGKIYVGQKIRLVSSSTAEGSGASSTTEDSGVEVTPIAPVGGGKTSNASSSSAAPQSPTVETKVEAPKPNLANANMGFIWPHHGEVIQAFKVGTNKGIDIAAKVGDPVLAAQAGKVVYVGDKLRGYGNLIIIRHDNNLLTAYAHNKTLLVQEGEPVTKGQKIAEAGQSDANRPKLHFEVRKQGKPVDPMDYLPRR